MGIVIFEDTGQVLGKHAKKNEYWKSLGIEVIRQQLNVGDYTLPANQSVCVDTKKDVNELYMDLVQDHKRFHNECVRAQQFGIKLYILVENIFGFQKYTDIIKWQNPQLFKYYKRCREATGMTARRYKWADVVFHAKAHNVRLPKPPCSNQHLIKVMGAMTRDYGVQFIFCSPDESGKRVLELLGVDLNG